MTVKLISTRVNDATWEVNTLPSGLGTTDNVGLTVLTWLLSIAGDPLGRIGIIGLQALRGGGADAQARLDLLAGIGEETLASALGNLGARLAEPATIKNLRILFAGMTRNKERVDLDLYFAANYGELIELAIWVIKVNFSSFFAAKKLFS